MTDLSHLDKSVPPREANYGVVKEASVRGAGVGLTTIGLQVLLQMSSVVVLSRLLTPEDFGLVGMALVLVNLLLVVGDWGLVVAAAQRKQIDHEQLSTLFWINAGGGLGLAVLTVACSPLLAHIFDEPRLVIIAMVLSVIFLAIGIGAQHEAIIRRRLRYGALHIVNVISYVIGIVVAVVGAFLGVGYWALIVQLVITRIVRTLLLWRETRWNPGRPGCGSHVGPLLKYGLQLAPSSLLLSLSKLVDVTLIGVLSGTTDLGFYRRGSNIVGVPTDYLKRSLGQMVPFSLSRLQDDSHGFSTFFLHSISVFGLASCGVVGLIGAEGAAIVTILLGDQWLAVIPLLRWLAVGGLASTIGMVTLWVLIPRGDLRKLLILRGIRLIFIVIGVFVGWKWGIVGVAAGYSLASCLSVGIELIIVTAIKGVRTMSLLGALVRPIIAASTAAIVVLFLSLESSIVTLLLESCLFFFVFLVAYAAMPGGWQVLQRAYRTMQKALRYRNAS